MEKENLKSQTNNSKSSSLNQELKTKDLAEAAYLYCKGCNLTRLESSNNSKDYYFVFTGQDCEVLSNEFWSREGNCIAKDYADALRSLKDRLFARGR